MGEVYKATHLKLKAAIALKTLKLLSPDPAEQKRFHEQFEIEAEILASLDHPNLARVSDFFEENGTAYLVMDFVEGKTLEEVATRGATEPETSQIAGR